MEHEECPICAQKVVKSEILIHVEKCLNPISENKLDEFQKPKKSKLENVNLNITTNELLKLNTRSWNFLNNYSVTTKQSNLKNSCSKITTPNRNKFESKTLKKIEISPSSNFKNNSISNDDVHKFNFKTESKKIVPEAFSISAINLNDNTSSSDRNKKIELENFSKPLAELLRPTCLDDVCGHLQLVGYRKTLRVTLENGNFVSMILWGPPGCGKTTIARIVSKLCQENNNKWRYVQVSATSSGVQEVKLFIETARNEKRSFGRKTVLFVDEIHRFNKLQQDIFLPCVEDGTISLLGATTENPSFHVNNALLSRCQIIVLDKLHTSDLCQILKNAISHLNLIIVKSSVSVPNKNNKKNLNYDESGRIENINEDGNKNINGNKNSHKLNNLRQTISNKPDDKLELNIEEQLSSDLNFYSDIKNKDVINASPEDVKNIYEKDNNNFPNLTNNVSDRLILNLSINEDVITFISEFSDGDARKALNTLQRLLELKACDKNSYGYLEINIDDVKNVIQRNVQYDKMGDEHYNAASALQKSIRGSDKNGSIYWLGRMLEGGEDPLFIARRLVVCASEDIGLADKHALPLSISTFQACHFIGMPECAINLAHCTTYLAMAEKSNVAYAALNRVRQNIRQHRGSLPGVPLHLRNAPTKLMKDLGYKAGYKYNHSFTEPVNQNYLPNELLGTDFFKD